MGEQDEIQDEKIDEKCPFCWGSLCPTVDPAVPCIGPPIQLPCCGKMYGKACILTQVSNKISGAKHCPCCRRKMWKGSSRRELIREAWIGLAGPEGVELLLHWFIKCALLGIIASTGIRLCSSNSAHRMVAGEIAHPKQRRGPGPSACQPVVDGSHCPDRPDMALHHRTPQPRRYTFRHQSETCTRYT